MQVSGPDGTVRRQTWSGAAVGPVTNKQKPPGAERLERLLDRSQKDSRGAVGLLASRWNAEGARRTVRRDGDGPPASRYFTWNWTLCWTQTAVLLSRFMAGLKTIWFATFFAA